MVPFLALILGFQLVGEVIARGLGLPIPGPLIGMLMLLVALLVRKGPSARFAKVADGLLEHLSLLFVPAGVGVVLHIALIRSEWLALVTALIVSTAAAIAVTALVFRALSSQDSAP